MNTDVYIRAYPKPIQESNYTNHLNEITHYTRPERVLVLDTETTDDEKQALKFGYFEIHDNEKLDLNCIFYNENAIKSTELRILRKYSKSNGINLMTRKEFIDNIFYPDIFYKETYCIGFNLPFDISRLAIDFGYARDKSMVNGFSLKLSNNMKYPRVLVKHVSNTISFIRFSRSLDRTKGNFRGNFIDLRTLGWAIRNEKYSLSSACNDFNSPIKKRKVKEHGKITPDYIDYCINDVKSTYQVYLAMLNEYEKNQTDLPITKAYSPASIGKALLDKMGIKSPSEKIQNIPDSVVGYIMSSYFGGRSEVKIRKKPVPIVYMDFLSMYPTVCTLMYLWKFVICDHIEFEEYTEQVTNFINGIGLEDLTNPKVWNQLHIIVEVEPHNDILPIRTKYDEQTLNIGINYLEGNGKRLWYTIHDVIVSKLLTGNTPKITRAIRFIPVGIQQGLKQIEFLGKKIDPVKDDFFKIMIEYRHELKSRKKEFEINSKEYKELDSKQYITKIIANATSYGIFIEVNTVEQESLVDVFGLDNFLTINKKIEKTGRMFNPIIAVLITGASKLMLGMAEAFVNKHNGYIAFMDTDSIAVNPELVDKVQEFFRPLNPYNFKDDVLQIEDENFMRTKGKKSAGYSINPRKDPLLFYGVSAKRYVLYRKSDSKINIIKNSEHGLGYLQSPFGEDEDKDWIDNFWEKALEDYYNNNDHYSGNNVLYSEYTAVSKQIVSSKIIMERFEKLNANKDYDDKIKPFNFFLIGSHKQINKKNKEPIIPLIPFTKDIRNITKQSFVDYKSCRKYQGKQYWKNLSEIYAGYFNHKEAKSDNEVGHLQRKWIIINGIIHIGKESSHLELTNIIGIGTEVDNVDEYRQINDFKLKRNSKLHKYIDDKFDKIKDWILSLHNVNLNKFEISKIMLYRVKMSIRNSNEKEIKKLTKLRFINCYNHFYKSELNLKESAVPIVLSN